MLRSLQRSRWADALLLSALAVLGWLAWRWQTRAADWSDAPERWVWAGLALLLWTGFVVWIGWRRQRKAAATALIASAPPGECEAGSTLDVIYASQTGFAAELAERSAQSLRSAGIASRALSIERIEPAALAACERVLLIASTTGEGDAPDGAAAFLRALAAVTSLSGLRFGLLALGDRDYQQYCGFGRLLDQRLRAAGAQPLFDRIEVDNGDPGALRHWQHQLRELAEAPELPDWEAPHYRPWILRQRRLLNPGSLGGEAWHIELLPDGDLPSWEAGDIVEIGPRHAQTVVASWLADRGWHGSLSIEHAGERRSLQDWLAGSHFPDASELAACRDPTALVARLQPLPHREYSIASLPEDGAIELLVRLALREDGQFGLGSGWLTRHAPIGGQIALRIRRNASFHLPADDRPLLLIGNGTGIAGLRALLKRRQANGHTRNWLIFGERQARIDAFFDAELRLWLATGLLCRLDRVWSRDGGVERYVQDRLRAEAGALVEWVEQGAAIYVCGSQLGMAGGVDAALTELLGAERVQSLREAGRYRRDVY